MQVSAGLPALDHQIWFTNEHSPKCPETARPRAGWRTLRVMTLVVVVPLACKKQCDDAVELHIPIPSRLL